MENRCVGIFCKPGIGGLSGGQVWIKHKHFEIKNKYEHYCYEQMRLHFFGTQEWVDDLKGNVIKPFEMKKHTKYVQIYGEYICVYI